MIQRYSLRFETGERQGEVVPIASARFTVGRRPGNSLQILENSVSGQHAELVQDGQGLLLRDLGSTNGTRVGHGRALEMYVQAGAQIWIGNVGLTLLDAEAPTPAGAEAVGGSVPGMTGATGSEEAEPQGAGPQGFEVSSEDLARAAKGSKSGLLLVVAVGALVGAGGWYFAKGAGSGATRVARPVSPVPGNLLEVGYSFESPEDDGGESRPRGPGALLGSPLSGSAGVWAPRETAPASYLETPGAAVSGLTGLRVELASGEWAVHASGEVRVVPGRLLRVGAALTAEGAARTRVGVELAPAVSVEGEDGEVGPMPGLLTAWSEEIGGAGEHGAVVSEFTVPPGYRRARVLILASVPESAGEASGAAEADDAWLVMQSGGSPSATLDEFKFFALGDPATNAALFRVDDLLVSGLRVREADATMGAGIATWASESMDTGVRLTPAGVAGPVTLHLRAEDDATAGGVATIAGAGYEAHGGEFDREGVTDLLLGKGLSLVRFRFPSPVTVRGRSAGSALQLACDLKQPAPVVLQLTFREELAAAANLAHEAQQAEDEGHLGLCMTKWQELLDTFPFDERHLAEAEATRGRLVLAGLEEARVLEEQIERARFFRLIDLYRECHSEAVDLARRYAGSEVEPEAQRMVREVGAEIAALEVDLDRHEKARLEGILRSLEGQGAQRLAGEVRGYLDAEFGTPGKAPGEATSNDPEQGAASGARGAAGADGGNGGAY